MLLLQLVSCLALVAGASSQTHSESSELGRLLCTNKSRIADIVHEYEMETEYDFGDVLLNCCVEGPGASLKKAIVSAFINDSSSNSTGVRFEFLYVSGTVVVRELRSAAALNYTWDGTHCYECNTSAPVGGELCSECHENCISCIGPANSMSDCQECRYSKNPSTEVGDYCLDHCEHGFNTVEGCKDCSGVLSIIGVAEAEAAEGSQEGGAGEEGEGATYLRFEYECLPRCPPGQRAPQGATDSPRRICFGGGIAFCNVSEGRESVAENCDMCYATLNLMEPLQFQERIRGEAMEKVEEEGGHFEENCLEHRICLTEKQSEECFEEFVKIQSEILREEIAAEQAIREEKDLALKAALPIMCGLVIIIFVSLSVFAHYRYPHISASGEKRHRKKKEEEEEEVAVNHTWRPRPTIRYR